MLPSSWVFAHPDDILPCAVVDPAAAAAAQQTRTHSSSRYAGVYATVVVVLAFVLAWTDTCASPLFGGGGSISYVVLACTTVFLLLTCCGSTCYCLHGNVPFALLAAALLSIACMYLFDIDDGLCFQEEGGGGGGRDYAWSFIHSTTMPPRAPPLSVSISLSPGG